MNSQFEIFEKHLGFHTISSNLIFENSCDIFAMCKFSKCGSFHIKFLAFFWPLMAFMKLHLKILKHLGCHKIIS